jgi:hypothetical protein
VATFQFLYDDALHTELGTNDTAVLFTTAKRKKAINEGLRQFAALTECWVKESTIDSTQGTQEFNLNSTTVIPSGDYVRMATDGPAFILSDSNGIQQALTGDLFPQVSIPYLDNAESGWRSTITSYPTGWYLKKRGGALVFGLDRPLGLSTASTQTAKILLPYVAKPSSMTSDTDVPFTVSTQSRSDLEEFHQALAHFGAHRLELLRKDKEASQQQLKEFLGYVQRYHDEHRPKGNRAVRTAIPYFGRARHGGRDRGGLLAPWWR